MPLNTFFGTRTVTATATAVSIDSLIRSTPGAGQAAAFAGSGIGCSLNFYAGIGYEGNLNGKVLKATILPDNMIVYLNYTDGTPIADGVRFIANGRYEVR